MIAIQSYLDGLDISVTRNIVSQLSKTISKSLGMTDNDHIIIGDFDQDKVTTGPSQLAVGDPSKQYNTLTVKYTEELKEDSHTVLSQQFNHIRPIYADNSIHASITPISKDTVIILNMVYSTKSRSQASVVVNKLRSKAHKSRSTPISIKYYYVIPEIVLKILSRLNVLKNINSDNQTFIEYCSEHFDPRLDIIIPSSGEYKDISLTINEVQHNTTLTEETDLININKELNDGLWEVNIEYKFLYKKPVSLVTRYPLSVFNTYIGNDYIPVRKEKITAENNTDGRLSLFTKKHSMLELDKKSAYLRIPEIDNFILPKPQSDMVRVFSVYVTITPTDRTTLLYLDEIPGVRLQPNILRLLELEIPYLSTDFNSIFNFSIYDHDVELLSNRVVVTKETHIDDNGESVSRIKLSASKPLPMSGCYRVTFNLITSLYRLPPARVEDLARNMELVDAEFIDTDEEYCVGDRILGVLNVDKHLIDENIELPDNASTIDIMYAFKPNIAGRYYTKQISMILHYLLTEDGA